MYDLEGNLVTTIKDYSAQNLDPDGVAVIDGLNFYVVLDGIDQFVKMNVFGEVLDTYTNTNFSGNLFQMAMLAGDLFFTESNTIESFSADGARIANPRIPTTVGSCVLSAPRSMSETIDGYLAVVGTGNDDLNIYDVSDRSSTTCILSNQTMGNLNPTAIITHSSGFLYVATQGDDAIYRFAADGSGAGTLIFNPGTATLNNPTALLELPDQSILIASDGTNDIIRISADGALLNAPFIKSAFTGQVGQMALIGGAE